MTHRPRIFGTPMIFGMPQEVQDSLAASIPFPARLGRPEDLRQLVHSIITNDMLNGETIRLDGAIRMPPKWRPTPSAARSPQGRRHGPEDETLPAALRLPSRGAATDRRSRLRAGPMAMGGCALWGGVSALDGMIRALVCV